MVTRHACQHVRDIRKWKGVKTQRVVLHSASILAVPDFKKMTKTLDSLHYITARNAFSVFLSLLMTYGVVSQS